MAMSDTMVGAARDAKGNPQAWNMRLVGHCPMDGRGDGNTPAYDWLFGPGLNLQLRAERDGRAPGRIYTVTVACTDASGNVGTGTATAICPHDMGGSIGPSLIVGKR